jgi:hypothetical protein
MFPPILSGMTLTAAYLITLIFSQAAQPQQVPSGASIEGIVVDFGSGQPIDGAVVEFRRAQGAATAAPRFVVGPFGRNTAGSVCDYVYNRRLWEIQVHRSAGRRVPFVCHTNPRVRPRRIWTANSGRIWYALDDLGRTEDVGGDLAHGSGLVDQRPNRR